MRLIYIKWFFQLIGMCIEDRGNFNENWSDFKVKIALDKDPEVKELLRKMNETLDKRENEEKKN